jgi:hypothetical protein
MASGAYVLEMTERQVCVDLYDWRVFPEQFAKSSDLDEKALYTVLVHEVGPTILEALIVSEARAC